MGYNGCGTLCGLCASDQLSAGYRESVAHGIRSCSEDAGYLMGTIGTPGAMTFSSRECEAPDGILLRSRGTGTNTAYAGDPDHGMS